MTIGTAIHTADLLDPVYEAGYEIRTCFPLSTSCTVARSINDNCCFLYRSPYANIEFRFVNRGGHLCLP